MRPSGRRPRPRPTDCGRGGSAPRWHRSAAKFGKQIRHADRRGIPFVWFIAADGHPDGHSVKDIRSGDQERGRSRAWTPPAEDRHPTVRLVTEVSNGR